MLPLEVARDNQLLTSQSNSYCPIFFTNLPQTPPLHQTAPPHPCFPSLSKLPVLTSTNKSYFFTLNNITTQTIIILT